MMGKQLTKDYFNQHPLAEISAARIEYSLLLGEGWGQALAKIIEEHHIDDVISDEQKKWDARAREAIAQEDMDGMMGLLRRPVRRNIKEEMWKKLLEQEEKVMPEIQKTILRTVNDTFIESAVYMFCRCKENYVPWLLEHYGEIRSPYARCLMCLVLGFRADPEVIPFLMREVDRMEREYPEKTFADGPVLALWEMKARFGDI